MSRRYGIWTTLIASTALLIAAVEVVSVAGGLLALAVIAVALGLAFVALVRWSD